jgi:hypothetical protein
MQKTFELFLIILFVLAASGCGKSEGIAENFTTQTGSQIVNMLKIEVPDDTYSLRSGTASTTSTGTNYAAFLSAVDTIAVPLRESNLRLAEVLEKGSLSTPERNIIVRYSSTGIIGDLTGVIDTTDTSRVNWTYTLNGIALFTGYSSLGGLSGVFTIPASALTTGLTATFSNSTVGSNLVRSLAIRKDASNAITFLKTYASGASTPSVVTLSGLVGADVVSGSWDSTDAGYYKRGTGVSAQQYCWNNLFQNTTNAQSPSTCPTL